MGLESHADAAAQLRVGTDVESITDVAASLERFGARYANRLYTDTEIATCGGISVAAAPRLAARFAAKEAVIKLLRPSDKIPGWRSIEVRTGANGAPTVHLSGVAAELAREQGIGPIAVSLSHGAGIGMATAVATATTAPAPIDGTNGPADTVEAMTTPGSPGPALDAGIAAAMPDRG